MNDNVNLSNPYAAPEGNLSEAQPNETAAFASLGARFGASLIDGVIMLALTMVPLIAFMGGWSNYVATAVSNGYLLKIGIGVVGFAIYVLINGYFLAQSGQSIGKKMVCIKIVRTDGSQPPLSHILLRRLGPTYIAQVMPLVGPLLIFIDVILIFRSSRQCVHDQIADTMVVNA